MKVVIWSLIGFGLGQVIAWFAGFNFDERGIGAAAAIVLGLWLALAFGLFAKVFSR